MPHPITTSSISPPSTLARSTAHFSTCAAIGMPCVMFSAPRCAFAIPVLQYETTATSFMVWSLYSADRWASGLPSTRADERASERSGREHDDHHAVLVRRTDDASAMYDADPAEDGWNAHREIGDDIQHRQHTGAVLGLCERQHRAHPTVEARAEPDAGNDGRDEEGGERASERRQHHKKS